MKFVSIFSQHPVYADDAKLYGRVNSQEHGAVPSRVLRSHSKLDKKQLSLNTQECKVLHWGSSNPANQYILEGSLVQEIVAESKDLCFAVDRTMKFHELNASSVKKANKMLGITMMSFDCLHETNMNLLYKVMIWLSSEYCNTAWGPHYKADQKKIEQIQRKVTRLLPCLDTFHIKKELKSWICQACQTEEDSIW